MLEKLLNLVLKKWKLFVFGFIAIDIVIVGGLLYGFATAEAERVVAAELNRPTHTPTPTATATPTPWPGPGPTLTRTPTLPPTPMSTDVLAVSGFPPGFTPTPRPTREAVFISLPYVYPANASAIDVPVINQIYYPEPFFPPGTNNACGPVALYAALQALGANVDYGRLRDIAVSNGFTHYGISEAGMVNTAAVINHELNSPYAIEHGNNYGLKDLMRHIRQRGVVTVLIRVRKEHGRYRVTADKNNSVGHFLIVDKIDLRNGTVKFAGSTLGMDEVLLQDFIQSWASDPQAVANSTNSWRGYLRHERAMNWALIIKRSRK